MSQEEGGNGRDNGEEGVEEACTQLSNEFFYRGKWLLIWLEPCRHMLWLLIYEVWERLIFV
jgi:hypothetical protein